MVLKDELNIPYEDAALLIEHLEQVCNKAEVITKRMERNVQEMKLSIEIERNMLALAQREEQEMCGSHTLQLVEKLYDNIKNTTLRLYAMCLFKPDVDLLSDQKNKFYNRCLSTASPDFGVHVRLEPSAIYVKLPLLWSRRNKSHKDMKSTAFERVTFFRDEINSSIKTAEGFDEYVPKPFSGETLIGTLRKVLDIKVEEEPVDEKEAQLQLLPEYIRNNPLIDVKTGLKNCVSAEGFIEIAEVFSSTYNAKAEEIRGFYEKEDLKGYTVKVHALKSSARLVGATKLSKDAAYLEKCGNDENAEEKCWKNTGRSQCPWKSPEQDI